MKILSLDVAAYGGLAKRRWDELPLGVALFYAKNEAGKSTLFHLLTTLLYGFDPANLESFPYRPWHIDEYPGFEAEIVFDDGNKAQVQRRLMKTPRGYLNWEDSRETLDNRCLPQVEHVGSRELYCALYALTLEDLTALGDRQEHEVRELLIGGLGTETLRPVHRVLEELEDEIKGLWKPDRRGRQLVRELEKARGKARELRTQALEEDRFLRDAHANLAQVKKRLEQIEGRIAHLRWALPVAGELLGANKQLKRIEEWERKLRDPDLVGRLPADVDGELARFGEEISKRIDALASLATRKEELKAQVQILSPIDERALEQREDIWKWIRRSENLKELQRNLVAIDGEIKDLCIRLETQGESLGGWHGEWAEALRALSLVELKGWIGKYAQAREEYLRKAQALDAKRASKPLSPYSLPGWFVLLWSLGGVLCLGLGRSLDSPPVLGVGAGGLMIGLALILIKFVQSRGHGDLMERFTVELKGFQEDLAFAREQMAAAQGEVAACVADLSLAGPLLDAPDNELYERIRELRGTLEMLDQKQKEHVGLTERLQEAEDNLGKLMSSLDQPMAEDPLWAIEQLQGLLGQAEERLARCKQAKEGLAELAKTEEAFRAEKDHLEGKLRELEELIWAVGAGADFEEAKKEAKAKQDILQAKEGMLKQLRRDYPDLLDLARRIEDVAREHPWMLDPEQVAASGFELESLENERSELKRELGSLTKEIEGFADKLSPGELEGQIQALDERIEAEKRRRDRLALLRCLIRHADVRFRRKHQPDVLRRAGDHLAVITGGKYRSLALMLDGEGREYLAVFGEDDQPIPVAHPLSRGILDQIYLAFRLAVVDHLDEGKEMLPLFFDETFVHWDLDRFRRGVGIIKDIAKRRQVFFFTCRKELARVVADVAGTDPIIL
ncbi:MAG: AAA family ATPase [Limnochordia bacterium]|jgi:uncharacterized protein YhaN